MRRNSPPIRGLSEYVVRNLNRDQTLPFGDQEFGGAAICVSVQYLTEPVKVFRQISRVLKDNAPLVVTFSNRCFPTKAVRIWNALYDAGHLELVREYFARSGSFGETEIRLHQPPGGDPLFGIIGRAKR